MRLPAGRRAAARRAAAPRRPRWWRNLARVAGLGLAACLVGGYALVWAVPPLRRLAAETIITSGHSAAARLVTTPAEYRAMLYAWKHPPTRHVVTAVAGSTADGAAAAPKPPVQLIPVTGSTYRGWIFLVRNPGWVHVVVTPYIGRVGEQTSSFGANTPGAIAAINGGGFEDAFGNGTGGLPVGVVGSFGHLSVYPNPTGGYVIGLDSAGRLDVGNWTLAQAEALGIRDAVVFQPLLVVHGQPQITQGDGGWGIAPRTAIGQRADGTLIFAIIDGRQPSSIGATLLQVQNLMLAEGAVTAVNLDGGSSTTLWYHGQLVNNPCCSPNGQRYIADAFVVVPPAGAASATAASATYASAASGS